MAEDSKNVSLSYIACLAGKAEGLEASSMIDNACREVSQRIKTFIDQMGSTDLDDRPVSLSGRGGKVRRSETVYKVNRQALINRFKKISLYDLLYRPVQDGLEEPYLEAVRVSFYTALHQNHGAVLVKRLFADTVDTLDVTKIQEPVAMAALIGIKDYLAETGRSHVSIHFAQCENVDKAEDLLKSLARKIDLDPATMTISKK